MCRGPARCAPATTHGMPNENRSLRPLVLAAIAIVVAGFLMQIEPGGHSEATELPSDGTEASAEGELDAVDLARANESGAASTSRAAAPSAVEATTVADSDSVRTWADLFAPIDAESGIAIADAVVLHVGSNGALRTYELSAAIGATDLDEDNLAALDSDEHCARFFVPSRVAAHEGPPQQVALARSATLRVALFEELPTNVESLTFVLERVGSRREPVEGSLRLVCARLDGLLDPEASDMERRVAVGALLRDPAAAPLLALGGAPNPVRGIHHQIVTGTFPLDIAELPVAEPPHLSVALDWSTGLRAHLAPDPALADFVGWDRSLFLDEVIAPDRLGLAWARVFAPATVRGRLEVGTERASIAMSRHLEAGRFEQQLTSDIEDDRSFVYGGLDPGPYRLTFSWDDPDDVRAFALREFELAPGEDRDLGLVTADPSADVTLVPFLVVDGARDDTLLDGALADLGAYVSITRYAPDESGRVLGHGEVFELASFDEVLLRGLAGSSLAFSNFRVELPSELAQSYRLVSPLSATRVRVGSSAVRVALPIVLESAAPVTLAVEVAAEVAVLFQPELYAHERSTGRLLSIGNSSGWKNSGTDTWISQVTAHVPLGDWTIVVLVESLAARSGMRDAEGNFSPAFVGRVEVAVSPSTPVSVELALERAAAVEFALPEGLPALQTGQRMMLRPHDLGSWPSDMWFEDSGTGRVLVARRLAPRTEWIVEPFGLRFRTLEPGSVARIGD